MTAADLGPAPGLVNDWVTWPLVILALCVAAVVILWPAARDAYRRTSREALDAVLEDERAQRIKDYYCAAHGHWYGRNPRLEATRRVWTCENCGDQAYVGRVDVPFDREAS